MAPKKGEGKFLALKETLNRLVKHEGVIGYMIIKINGGIPVKSSLSPGLTHQYAHLSTSIIEEVQVKRLCMFKIH